MIAFALLPFMIAAWAAFATPRLAARMRPRAAATMVAALALSVALTLGVTLCLVAVVGLAEALPALRPDDWSLPVLHRLLPVPAWAAVAAGVVAAGLLVNAAAHLVRVVISARRAAAQIADLPEAGGLTVVPGDEVHAYAVPGLSWRRGASAGRIVVSHGLLQALDPAERRALLAHERAHLEQRHHLWAQAVRLAVSACPPLTRLESAMHDALERWADDLAARSVGDPRIVVRALAAVADRATPPPATAFAATGAGVVARARYLLDPPRPSRLWTGLVAGAIIACWVSTIVVTLEVHTVVEIAEEAFSTQ